jgi:hypothetical protein
MPFLFVLRFIADATEALVLHNLCYVLKCRDIARLERRAETAACRVKLL